MTGVETEHWESTGVEHLKLPEVGEGREASGDDAQAES